MADPSSFLEFQIDVAAWRRVPRIRARLKEAAQATLDQLPKRFRFSFEANILLTGNAQMRQLNRDFRGIDKPTNVLSFPQFDPKDLAKTGKQKAPVALGDIALAYAYTVKEARETNKLAVNHAIHLVIHGLLHLFGYDHGSDEEANVMEKLEIKIMKALGLNDPYALIAPGRKTTR